MHSSKSIPRDVQLASDEIRSNWILFLVHGVVIMILGVLAVIWPQISTVAVDFYVGWMFLISGIVGLATIFFAPNSPAFLWSLLTAALALIVGVLLLWHPVQGTVSLTLVLIAFFLVEGIFQIVAAIRYRDEFPDSWGWMVMSGIADLVLAGAIISGWPGTASWALGLIVGVNLITSGFAITMGALAARGLVDSVGSGTR